MVRVSIVEGTPDEIRQLFPHLAEGQNGVVATAPNGNVPADVQQVLEHTRPIERAAIQRFVDEVMGWEGVSVKAGQKRDGGFTAYLRFHRNGHGAAFAYLYPRRMYVRPHLPAKELKGARFAAIRGGRAADGDFSRNLTLSPQEAWDEAVKFTKRAYEAAGE
jgi:hypothetical protein